RTACFRRAQVKPWTIVAVVPDRELFASVRTIQFYLLLFGSLMLGGAVFAVLYLAGRVSRLIHSVVSELDRGATVFCQLIPDLLLQPVAGSRFLRAGGVD
ncbi:MAG TPA: hypothetical protein VMT32_07905, partial [Bryobacteraceae bacterium]|nr:hypothetical protein [Bryobacteraceae bacterium]